MVSLKLSISFINSMKKIVYIPYGNSRYSVIWPLLYMAGIFCLSSIPDYGSANSSLNPLAWITPNVQNFLHLPVYAGLASLWFWALRHWMTESGYRIVLTLIVTVGFGLFDEWHQTFVPGRYGSLTDAGFNVIGAVMGLLVYRSWFSVREYNL